MYRLFAFSSFAAFVIGVSAAITQLVLLREFLGVFAGIEIIIGIILGTWLILTACGSLFAQILAKGREPFSWLSRGLVASPLIGPLGLLGIRTIRSAHTSGLVFSISEAMFYSVLVLLPYCLLAGLLLALCARTAALEQSAGTASQVYIADTVGSTVGGLAYGFLLVHIVNPFAVLAIPAILCLAASAVISHDKGGNKSSLPPVTKEFCIAGIILAALLPLADQPSLRLLYPHHEIIRRQSTPHGQYVLVQESAGQFTVFHDGTPAGTTTDAAAGEEIVHFAMTQHKQPKHVMLLGGSLTGAGSEILKYPAAEVDAVESDPAVFVLARLLSRPQTNRLREHAVDPRRFIQQSADRFDVILLAFNGPTNAQMNRFYTVEFFRDAKRALRENGVISLGLSGSENYTQPELQLFASSIYRSLCSVFKNCAVIPGARFTMLASDAALTTEIGQELENRGISTAYINDDYLTARLTPQRIAQAERAVSAPAPFNKDLHPVSYLAQLRHWLSQFGETLAVLALAIVVAAALLAVLVAASPAPALTTAVGMSGLAGMGLQVALIIAFQAAHGSIHQWLSFIFAAFLAGTAAGAVWSKRTQRPHQAVVLGMDILLACCGLLLPLLLPYAVSWPHSASGTFTVGALFFPLANAVAGFAVGAQFPAALALFSRHGTAESSAFNFCYALDLAGACLGAFAVGAIAVPAFGLLHTCAALGGAKAATAFWLALEHKTQHQAPRVRTNGSFWTKAAVTVVFVVCIGVVQLEAPNRMLYSFSFNRFYHLLLVGLLGWGIARAISYVRAEEQGKGNGLLVRLDRKTAKTAGLSFFRLVNYCGFALAVFYPLGRCYFSLPYLFCHVCPRKCVFGFLRPYLVPAALIMNLERRHWCFHACPIGTVHDCQIAPRRRSSWLPQAFTIAAYASLLFTVVSYFKLLNESEADTAHGSWYSFFFLNRYALPAWAGAAAMLLFIAAFRFRRTFCSLLCPIGTFSSLVHEMAKIRSAKDAAGEERV